jgi:hypothetical protein
VIAYAMLAGRLPFEGKTAGDVLAKHLTQEPPPLRSLAPNLAEATVQTVERCLAKDAALRWPDARAFKLALGVADEPEPAETVRAAEGQGVLFTIIGLVTAAALSGAADGPLRTGILTALGIQLAVVYVFATIRMWREGTAFGETQRVIWREPSWWPFWYPRGLRRRATVWDRLPASVRRVRAWPLVIFAWSFLLTFGLRYTWGTVEWRLFSPATHLGLVAFIVASIGGLMIAWPILMRRTVSELEGRGLDRANAQRVAFAMPTGRVAFWLRPHIDAVLGPAQPVEPRRRADSPHDQLQSILRNADDLSGPLRALGAQAAVAARQLVTSIEHADRDLAELARSLDPGEEERLTAKIEALGTGSAEVRILLEKQLDLVRELSARIEEGREERNRRVEMLKTLALNLTSLRARAAEAPTEVPSLSDRVRQLCDEIGGQALALAQARTEASGSRR